MARTASGFMSYAICDRCGFRYKYTQLRKEWQGLRSCDECWSMKHPQLNPVYPPTEPQALLNPRPDRFEPVDVPVGQNIFPFIQNTSTQVIAIVGIVTVEVS